MEKVFILLFLFQLKHFLADYPLQTPYMLGKFKPGLDFLKPLLAHTLVHALFTLIIVLPFSGLGMALKMAMFDMIIHFIMDRIKASPNLLGRYKALSACEYKALMLKKEVVVEANTIGLNDLNAQQIDYRKESNTYFWWALGLDQAVHHLTHYAIIYMILK